MVNRVGMVGLGRMGQPMCRHILRAGFVLTVYDVQPAAIDPLVALGARAAASVREVAEQSEIVLIMVADDAQVRDVIAGPNGVMEGAAPGTVVAIHSSIRPDTCRELAEITARGGVGLVDAPVAHGQRGAEAGELTVFCGGAVEHYERCRPVLSAFGQALFHMGPVGAGQITKTCNNLLHWAGIVACYETLSLGERVGIPANTLRPALLAGSADSRTLRELELVKLAWPDKDMTNAMALAEASETPVPLMAHVRELVKGITVDDLRGLFDQADGSHQQGNPDGKFDR